MTGWARHVAQARDLLDAGVDAFARASASPRSLVACLPLVASAWLPSARTRQVDIIRDTLAPAPLAYGVPTTSASNARPAPLRAWVSEAHCHAPTRAESDVFTSSSAYPVEDAVGKPSRLTTLLRSYARVVLVLSRTDCAPCRAQVSWVSSLAEKASRSHVPEGETSAVFEVLLEESASARPHDLAAFRGGAPLLLWPAGARQFPSVPKSLLVEHGKLTSVCDGMLVRPSAHGEQIQSFLKP